MKPRHPQKRLSTQLQKIKHIMESAHERFVYRVNVREGREDTYAPVWRSLGAFREFYMERSIDRMLELSSQPVCDVEQLETEFASFLKLYLHPSLDIEQTYRLNLEQVFALFCVVKRPPLITR